MSFSAQSGSTLHGGAITVTGSTIEGMVTSIAGGGHRRVLMPAAPLSLWRHGRMLKVGKGLTAVAAPVTSSGVDAILGPFEEFSQSWICDGEERDGSCLHTSLRVLKNRPAVIWRQEWPRGTSGASSSALGTPNAAICTFPAWAGGAANSTEAPLRLGDLGFVTWTGEFAVTPAWRAGRWPVDYGKWAGDWAMYAGPLTLLDESGRSLVVGPLSGFTSAVNVLSDDGTGLAAGPHGMVEVLPPGFISETAMVLGSGVVASQMGYGSLLLDAHGKSREPPDVSDAVGALMYSADGYPYYDPASGNSTCGNYEDVYLAISKANKAQGLPFRTNMLDSFWYGQAIHNGIFTWDANSPCFASRFPHGLPWLRGQMGVDFVAHMGTWLKTSPYAASYAFVDDPTTPYALPTEAAFWVDLFHNATRGPASWGLSVMKQDHQDQQIGCDWNHGTPVCHRWRGLAEPQILTNWLAQMAAGARSQGVTIEYGTTIARFILNTVTLPAGVVTHARGANDYCIRAMKDAWRIGAAAGLFWSVGIYTTKDTFFSSSNETAPGGSLKGYHERYPELHAAVSALSAGPVSPSDAPGAANVSLLMRTCRADGVLLKPDAPAMPLDDFWIGHAFCAAASAASSAAAAQRPSCVVEPPAEGELWATASRLGNMVWPLVFASLTSPFTLRLPAIFKHLRSVPSIHADGTVALPLWAPPSLGWLLFRPGAPLARQPPRLIEANATLSFEAGAAYGDFTLNALSPVVAALGDGPDWSLLGETDKFVPVSRQRIKSVEADRAMVRVQLVGAAHELVTLRLGLAEKSGGDGAKAIQVVLQSVRLGADGRGVVAFDVS